MRSPSNQVSRSAERRLRRQRYGHPDRKDMDRHWREARSRFWDRLYLVAAGLCVLGFGVLVVWAYVVWAVM